MGFAALAVLAVNPDWGRTTDLAFEVRAATTERMSSTPVLEVREARLPADTEIIRRLWVDYLTWGNDQMQACYGVHAHSPREAVEQDIAAIGKFQAPHGRLVLAFRDGAPCGIGGLRRLNDEIAEIKRMYVDPTFRRAGAGRAIVEYLLAAARGAGYKTVRLDSLKLMTAAHELYRRCGFRDIECYPESEISEQFKAYLVFMECSL